MKASLAGYCRARITVCRVTGAAMLFAIICADRPRGLDLRLATRPAHLAYLATYADCLVHAGPLLDADGRPCGSLLIIDVEDRATAEGFAASDPYSKAGLFESAVIRPFRTVAHRTRHRIRHASGGAGDGLGCALLCRLNLRRGVRSAQLVKLVAEVLDLGVRRRVGHGGSTLLLL